MNSNEIKLLVYLLQGKKQTATSLSERLCVSKRTIYRYIDTLSLSNIPILTKKGKNGGIYLFEDFNLCSILKDNHK